MTSRLVKKLQETTTVFLSKFKSYKKHFEEVKEEKGPKEGGRPKEIYRSSCHGRNKPKMKITN